MAQLKIDPQSSEMQDGDGGKLDEAVQGVTAQLTMEQREAELKADLEATHQAHLAQLKAQLEAELEATRKADMAQLEAKLEAKLEATRKADMAKLEAKLKAESKDRRDRAMVRNLRLAFTEVMVAPQSLRVFGKRAKAAGSPPASMPGGSSHASSDPGSQRDTSPPPAAAATAGGKSNTSRPKLPDVSDCCKPVDPDPDGRVDRLMRFPGVNADTRAHLVKYEFLKFLEDCRTATLPSELDAVRRLLRGSAEGENTFGAALGPVSRRNLLNLAKSLEGSMDAYELVFEPLLPEELTRDQTGPYYKHWRVRVLDRDAELNVRLQNDSSCHTESKVQANGDVEVQSKRLRRLEHAHGTCVEFDIDRVSLRALLVAYVFGLTGHYSDVGRVTSKDYNVDKELLRGMERALLWLKAHKQAAGDGDDTSHSMGLLQEWFKSLDDFPPDNGHPMPTG